jgi:hypothetical protein
MTKLHVPPPGKPSSMDVPLLGRFVFDGGWRYSDGSSCCHYVFRIDTGGKEPALVLAYLEDDETELSRSYAEHIRRTVEAVTPDCRAFLHAARQKLLDMMDLYEIDAPADYDELVDELRITHIKPFVDGRAELIFDLCSWIQNFNINLRLDAKLQFEDIWFDG